MRLSELISSSDCVSNESCDFEIDGIATNAATVEGTSLFIVENSEKAPDFTALENRPVAVLCDRAIDTDGIPKIIVENARRSSAEIHSRFYRIDYSRLKIIGITGTNGKTTTATIIYEVLRKAGVKAGFIGTGRIETDGKAENDDYYSMTTPDPAVLYKTLKKMQQAGCTHIVMEVSSHALVLDKVAPITFNYGIFTNFSPEHLDFHNNIDSYLEAKKKLLDKSRTCVFNIDDSTLRAVSREHTGRKITAGVLYRGDAYATHVENLGLAGTTYIYQGKNFSFKMRSSLVGMYNVYNTLIAAAALIDMGIAPCFVKSAIAKIQSPRGRFEIIKDELTVIIDYAHTEKAYESFLREASKIKGKGRLITVFGCGGNRDREKRPKIAKVVEKYSDVIIVTADNSRDESTERIFDEIICGFESNNYSTYPSRKDAIKAAVELATKNDVIAIVGKGAEKYNIDNNGYHYYSESETVKEALKERRQHANKA
ncbi:MAG: UDP-N-acetylmuramoyl-L-alanyl-D-glutamate--2,6-diaminopimelate ligase [Clostridia bacterium]|nr:UDP-N-acetylmuramoyl-L-alanyl-D-glutamate--2,6-diaminopimelate ligase [Clostridia bacterium]